MNKKNNIDKLAKHLEQEIHWVQQLNALLVEEKNILNSRKFDGLEVLAAKKQDLSSQLEESTKARVALFGFNGPQDKAPSLREFLKTCSPEETTRIGRLNDELAEELSLCRELNTVNGQVIATNVHTRQQIVQTLSGGAKTEAVNVYTATGNLKSSPTKGKGEHREA